MRKNCVLSSLFACMASDLQARERESVQERDLKSDRSSIDNFHYSLSSMTTGWHLPRLCLPSIPAAFYLLILTAATPSLLFSMFPPSLPRDPTTDSLPTSVPFSAVSTSRLVRLTTILSTSCLPFPLVPASFLSLSFPSSRLPALEFASTILRRNNSTLRSATTAYVTRNNSRTCDPIHREQRRATAYETASSGASTSSRANSQGGLQRFLVSISLANARRYTFQAGHPDPRPIASLVFPSNRSRAFHFAKPYRPNTLPNRSGSETRANACSTDSERIGRFLFLSLCSYQVKFPFTFFCSEPLHTTG